MEEERKLENLASDCLVCIFCHLGLEELTVALPFVCKSWYEASLDPQCWKKLDFLKLDFHSRSNFVRRFKEAYGIRSSFSISSFMKHYIERSQGSAVELAISYDRGYWTLLANLVSALIGCPKIKVVEFPSIHPQDLKKLSKLISKWKELEILKIPLNSISFIEIFEQISINCPNFIGLYLHGLLDNTNITKAIVRYIPRLKILVIRRSIICNEDLMEILEGCNELEVLNVSNCAGFDVDDEILMKTSKIKKFEYKDTTKEDKIICRLLLD